MNALEKIEGDKIKFECQSYSYKRITELTIHSSDTSIKPILLANQNVPYN